MDQCFEPCCIVQMGCLGDEIGSTEPFAQIFELDSPTCLNIGTSLYLALCRSKGTADFIKTGCCQDISLSLVYDGLIHDDTFPFFEFFCPGWAIFLFSNLRREFAFFGPADNRRLL